MISVLQSAQLCAEVYNMVPANWDHWWQTDEVICAHRVIGDEDTLTFMGSKLVTDWMRDAAAAIPWWDSELGWIPFGFGQGSNDVLAEISQVITNPLTIQGHSLGGVRARIAAAKMLYRGQAVKRLCVFGSPKPGFANVGRIFDKCLLDRDSFRNRNDPVPLTPLTLMPLLPWAHTEAWKVMDENDAHRSDLDPLRDHAILDYIAGATKLCQTPA
jgi:pimeloyl-ACP methyl ester carboxylesterase